MSTAGSFTLERGECGSARSPPVRSENVSYPAFAAGAHDLDDVLARPPRLQRALERLEAGIEDVGLHECVEAHANERLRDGHVAHALHREHPGHGLKRRQRRPRTGLEQRGRRDAVERHTHQDLGRPRERHTEQTAVQLRGPTMRPDVDVRERGHSSGFAPRRVTRTLANAKCPFSCLSCSPLFSPVASARASSSRERCFSRARCFASLRRGSGVPGGPLRNLLRRIRVVSPTHRAGMR